MGAEALPPAVINRTRQPELTLPSDLSFVSPRSQQVRTHALYQEAPQQLLAVLGMCRHAPSPRAVLAHIDSQQPLWGDFDCWFVPSAHLCWWSNPRFIQKLQAGVCYLQKTKEGGALAEAARQLNRLQFPNRTWSPMSPWL